MVAIYRENWQLETAAQPAHCNALRGVTMAFFAVMQIRTGTRSHLHYSARTYF